jgi:hypothetical protein
VPEKLGLSAQRLRELSQTLSHTRSKDVKNLVFMLVPVFRQAGLQNRPGRVTHGLLGSTPGPLRRAVSGVFLPIVAYPRYRRVSSRVSAQDRSRAPDSGGGYRTTIARGASGLRATV